MSRLLATTSLNGLLDQLRAANRTFAGPGATLVGSASPVGGPVVAQDPAGAAAVALEAAVRARAPALHALTPLLQELVLRLSDELDLDLQDRGLAEVCVRVRDVGMLALPDSVVLSAGPLGPAEWEQVNRHPEIGAELLESLPGLRPAATVVRAHHERWDGEGYPAGLRGEQIPLLSRVIAACEAFAAIAGDRPHRRGIGVEGALEQLAREQGRQFDPHLVDTLTTVINGGSDGRGEPARPHSGHAPAGRAAQRPQRSSQPAAARGIRDAVGQFNVLPAFAPAVERLLEAIATTRSSSGSDAVAAVESDIGLTVAVLRAAQLAGGRWIMNVSDALEALTGEQIRAVVESLPRAAFPWRTRSAAVMHQLLVHSQAVARAAQRLAREIDLPRSDDLLTVALLHDVGKLVMVEAQHGGLSTSDQDSVTPEVRVQQERRLTGLDHAAVGGLLLTRWGLPKQLAEAVALHHRAERDTNLAVLVRLADMVAHHAHGDAVDRKLMLRLAATCEVSVEALRDVLFDLPRVGGSRRRRAERSPLSTRETAVLRRLAEGKVYKQIGDDLGLSTSTVRTHLHNIYAKLGVTDRAQAVLLATEMAWL